MIISDLTLAVDAFYFKKSRISHRISQNRRDKKQTILTQESILQGIKRVIVAPSFPSPTPCICWVGPLLISACMKHLKTIYTPIGTLIDAYASPLLFFENMFLHFVKDYLS